MILPYIYNKYIYIYIYYYYYCIITPDAAEILKSLQVSKLKIVITRIVTIILYILPHRINKSYREHEETHIHTNARAHTLHARTHNRHFA